MSVWTTRKGEVVPMSELSDSHLQNIKAMLERNAEVIQEAAELAVVRNMGGNAGRYAAEQMSVRLSRISPLAFIASYHRPYKDILKEIARRESAST